MRMWRAAWLYVPGLHEQADLDGSHAAVEVTLDHVVSGLGGPGEVVDVFAAEGQGLGAVFVNGFGKLHPAGAHDFVLRQGELYIEGAEVGKEFCVGMELMTVPRPLPPDADLGEPLRSHHEIVAVAGAGEDLPKLVVERDPELHRFVRRHRARQLDLEHGAVIGIAIVGSDKLDLRGQIAHADHFQRLHLGGSLVLVFPLERQGGRDEPLS